MTTQASLHGSLTSFSSLDIVDLIHMTRKSGQLQVRQDAAEKNVFFEEGEIVFATSNLNQDRLGESLVRSGRLTQEQFERACQLLKPGVRLGKLLVDEGFLNPETLWIGVKNQVEEIFYSVLRMNRGEFYFYEGKPRTQNTVRLSRSVHALIFEGVKQAEELKIFVEKIISQKTVFGHLHLAADVKLTDLEQQILRLIDGRKTVREILLQSPSSAFVTLKVLSNLMLAHVIVPLSPSAPKEPQGPAGMKPATGAEAEDPLSPVQEIIHLYQRIFGEIQAILSDHGQDMNRDLKDYVETLEEPHSLILRDFSWRRDGGLSENLILNNLQRVSSHQRDELVARVFEDLLSFLLFKAQGILPKEIFTALFATTQDLLHQGAAQKET